MKRVLLSIACMALGMGIYAQTWINAGSASASEPQVTMMSTGNQTVRFKVALSGFYSEMMAENYKRLSIPGCDVTTETGAPELPVLTKMIAVPECAGISCSINVVQRSSLNGYKVYPAPDYQQVTLPDGTPIWKRYSP